MVTFALTGVSALLSAATTAAALAHLRKEKTEKPPGIICTVPVQQSGYLSNFEAERLRSECAVSCNNYQQLKSSLGIHPEQCHIVNHPYISNQEDSFIDSNLNIMKIYLKSQGFDM